jgi:hypothetical protein
MNIVLKADADRVVFPRGGEFNFFYNLALDREDTGNSPVRFPGFACGLLARMVCFIS